MQKITTFLTFNNQTEEAVNFYVSIFKNSKVLNWMRMGPEGPVMSATFQLEGQNFMALNGGPSFSFAQGFSLFVSCDTQAEIDELWSQLSAGGSDERCGWVKDKFGVSWQLVPPILGKYLGDKHPAKAKSVLDAMLKMHKLDIAALQEAYDRG